MASEIDLLVLVCWVVFWFRAVGFDLLVPVDWRLFVDIVASMGRARVGLDRHDRFNKALFR